AFGCSLPCRVIVGHDAGRFAPESWQRLRVDLHRGSREADRRDLVDPSLAAEEVVGRQKVRGSLHKHNCVELLGFLDSDGPLRNIIAEPFDLSAGGPASPVDATCLGVEPPAVRYDPCWVTL